MKSLILFFGIGLGLNSGIALAQHENMPGHDTMDAGHAGMPQGDKAKPEKKKETEKKPEHPPGHQK